MLKDRYSYVAVFSYDDENFLICLAAALVQIKMKPKWRLKMPKRLSDCISGELANPGIDRCLYAFDPRTHQ